MVKKAVKAKPRKRPAPKKTDIELQLIDARIKLRECQAEYQREHEKLRDATRLVNARENVVKAYTAAREEARFWMGEWQKLKREIERLSKELAKAQIALKGKQ